MRVQLCEYRRGANKPWQSGLAFLDTFDVGDVKFIVDDQGRKLTRDQVWEYSLTRNVHYGYISNLD